MVLSGWTVHAGSVPYEGTMTKGSDSITASIYGAHESLIMRLKDIP